VDDPLGPSAEAAPAAAAAPAARADAGAQHRAQTSRASAPQRVVWVWPARGRVLRGFAEGGSKGVDIGARLGAPVRAAADGRVVYSGSGLVGYGKLIILKHNNSYLSAYAHNDRLLVKEGDSVVGGQRIAHMGQTGTQEVKLHFEIRRDGKPVDPLKYLPTRRPRQEDSDA
jgi:lipoprotein NlpD